MISFFLKSLLILSGFLVGYSVYVVGDDFQSILNRATSTNQISALEKLNDTINNGGDFNAVAAAQNMTKQQALKKINIRYEQLEEMGFTKEEILADLTMSIESVKSNYNCSTELSKYQNLPDLANYEKLNDILCQNNDDEKFYTAFGKNLKDGLENLFKS